MTPCQKIQREILLDHYRYLKEEEEVEPAEQKFIDSVESGITKETVAEQYDMLIGLDAHWDYESEFRCSGVETKLQSEWSRHYEAKEVATLLSDGTWIGWTYWYGGGKHGDPGRVEWMEHAYNLEMKEVTKMVTIQEFKKVD